MKDYQDLAKICNKESEPFKSKYGFEDFYPCGIKCTPMAFTKNETTGIMFEYEMRDNCIFQWIYRLPVGKFKPTRGGGVRNNSNEYYNNFELFALRNSAEYDLIKSPSFINETINETIRSHLQITETYADDILCGDFTVFTELKKIVIARAKAYGVPLNESWFNE